ncbi:hypothetical protein E3U36_10215 [Arsenophonus endosymbiont of Aphis craccivora]|uniref:hypothetical protein n=1 Tax=Arsenophonus endosymbiont of Aphis craccivora TaxID=1231049 RepID=UPI0015DC72D4|nr:hypothetical protein [Arsenophonus endosymbiont of Aphis craccivora]QLK88335.1 hypothetical protein E3U36_10215 [Arsenophonus endosymbiont of Aphis craccivora]
MPWGPDVETNLAISSANHLKVRFIQQSPFHHNWVFWLMVLIAIPALFIRPNKKITSLNAME